MSTDYAILAPVYDRIGLSDFATRFIPNLLTYIQQNEWMGRRVLDLGCGTGACALWFAGRGYTVFGLDQSSEMLTIANTQSNGRSLAINWMLGDARQATQFERIDLVISLGLMNEMANLKDFEAVIKNIADNLPANRFFVFDLLTIQGLTEMGRTTGELLTNTPDLAAHRRMIYDHDRQNCAANYLIFEAENGIWKRSTAQLTMRSYPVSAVAALLRKHQFEIVSIVNTRLETIDPLNYDSPRVVFTARKGS